MCLWSSPALGVFLAFLFSFQLKAEKFVFKPIADTSLVEVSPTNNFGKTPHLRVGGDSIGRNRSLIKFDVSSIPSTSKVVAASLRVTLASAPISHGGGPIWVFRTLRDWTEGTKGGPSGAPASANEAAWLFPKNPDDLWAEPGGKWIQDFSFERSGDAQSAEPFLPTFINFNQPGLAKDLQVWVDRPESNFGWFLYHSTDQCQDQFGRACYYPVYLSSREDEQNSPQLTVFTGNPDAPRVFLNGDYVDQDVAPLDTLNASEIRLESPYPGGHIFFTLDRSKPSLLSPRYEPPFAVSLGDVLRIVTYSSDYSLGGVEKTVVFGALPTFILNISTVGSGSFSLSPSPSTTPMRYSSNRVIRLGAIPISGWRFAGWSGDIQTAESNVVFALTRDISVQANFVPEGPRLAARRIQNDFLLVQITDVPDYDFSVQSSSDLRAWVPLQSVANKTGVVDAIFPLDPSAQPKFYRVVRTAKGSPVPY